MLKGKNIALRPLQLSDLDFLYAVENNSENWQYGSERKYFSKEDLVRYINNADEDISVAKQYRFVIDKENTPIGFIDLFDYKIKSAGVGVIITKKHRRKGLAKEALQLLCTYAFKTLNLTQLHCSISKDNLASINLFTACGFGLEREENLMLYFTTQKIALSL